MVPWATAHQPLKSHLDQFSRFCRAHEQDQHTDRQTHIQQTCYSAWSDMFHLTIAFVTVTATSIVHVINADSAPGGHRPLN